MSVWFAKKNHIAVYPTGMISTGIFVYILYQANLLGDMLINGYFFIMSIYGWFFWTKKTEGFALNTIGFTSKKDKYVEAVKDIVAPAEQSLLDEKKKTSATKAKEMKFDDEEEEMWDKKKGRVVNNMLDTILRGSGVYGAAASTIKNMIMRFQYEAGKDRNPDYT